MNTIVESCSTMSACDKLTMDTMINVSAYSKYISKRDTDVKTRSDETKNERRFYKKRIVELTKQLIKNMDHVKDSSVVNACSAYFNACILLAPLPLFLMVREPTSVPCIRDSGIARGGQGRCKGSCCLRLSRPLERKS